MSLGGVATPRLLDVLSSDGGGLQFVLVGGFHDEALFSLSPEVQTLPLFGRGWASVFVVDVYSFTPKLENFRTSVDHGHCSPITTS